MLIYFVNDITHMTHTSETPHLWHGAGGDCQASLLRCDAVVYGVMIQ